MVNINLAYTAPVNPAGASPTLTIAQLWAGLEHKVRRAQDFVPAITACDVVREEANMVERLVYFKAGVMQDQEEGEGVREVCKLYEPAKVDFHRDDGSVVSNIISVGGAGETDIYMTYYFEWLHPDVDGNTSEGKAKVEELSKHHHGVAKMAVDKSIETIRRMVSAGSIE